MAPYSQWQNLTFDPPMVMFAANQYPDGRRKDTVLNAEQTGWFVWNMATYDLREAVNISAMALPRRESEFDRSARSSAWTWGASSRAVTSGAGEVPAWAVSNRSSG